MSQKDQEAARTNRNQSPRIEHGRLSSRSMVCSVDHLATAAGTNILALGGSAADAAIAASAVLTITNQHMCGMGGDLWAVIHTGGGPPQALNASGRAGSGSDAATMRSEGHTSMPFRGDIRAVPIPGCVDGWLSLHEKYGAIPLAQVLAPAIEIAEQGFPATMPLARAAQQIAAVDGAQDFVSGGRTVAFGQRVTRPGLARSLRAIVNSGRSGWYEGEFGQGLMRVGGGLYSDDDLLVPQVEWTPALGAKAWGHTVWTTAPNSQGYLSLAGAVLADGLADMPVDTDDPLWAHYLIESSKQAAFDRSTSLFDGASGAELVSEKRLASRRARISATQTSQLAPPGMPGGTIYLCAVDENRMGVSLIQSNAAGFGSHLAIREVGVFLQNRGIGFSLEQGHPAELQPGRRPPSTLSPGLITTEQGALRTVLGTMGGDGQPQIVLQMLAHLLQAGSSPGQAVTLPRFTLTVPEAVGFDTWDKADRISVAIENGSGWAEGLANRGHDVQVKPWGSGLFGHAHLIDVVDDYLCGVAEPRTGTSAAIGR